MDFTMDTGSDGDEKHRGRKREWDDDGDAAMDDEQVCAGWVQDQQLWTDCNSSRKGNDYGSDTWP
jgi:hypothetical protein